jgi:hypothetical protein
MPRVSPCAAIVLALVFGSAAIGAAASLSVWSTARTVEIGASVQVEATYPGTQGLTVHLFAGTATGSTLVWVNGKPVVIPVGGNVFAAGTAGMSNGAASIDASIPDDPSLIGERVCWVAVLVDASGRVVAIARSGGPIIEDAIC